MSGRTGWRLLPAGRAARRWRRPRVGPGEWLVLVSDLAIRDKYVAAIVAAGGTVPAVGDELDRIARELRRPVLEMMAELTHATPELAWWASRVGERSPQTSDVFLHLCWIHLALGRPGVAGVICDSPAVLATLAAQTGTRPEGARSVLPWRLKSLARIARFVLREAGEWVATPAPGPGRPLQVLMRTWVDADAIRDGRFHERYFPGLPEWLVSRGLEVATVPVLPSAAPRAVSRWWRAAGTVAHEFLPVKRVIRWRDRLFGLRVGLRAARLPSISPDLAGVTTRFVLDEARHRAAFDSGTLEHATWSRLPLRLRERGFVVERLILEYEQLIPEKCLICGFRIHQPQARIVGFQHGAIYPLFLPTFVIEREAAAAPLPDVVVCNGELFRDVLVAEGLPADCAVVGPALRYAHLRDRPTGRRKGSSVLVPLPMYEKLAAEVLSIVSSAFADDPARVVLKLHPMGPSIDLPPGMRSTSARMDLALAEASVVVGLASSALHEAVAAGRPVVTVGRTIGIDMNPLDLAPGLSRTVRTAKELRAETERLLALNDAELAEFQGAAQRLMEMSFAPITDDALETFLR